MSVVIAGLFPGERIGMLGAFVCWICICVFVASYLRGYQAYAAVLSGYTVAIIALVNIDTPQNVFTTMTDRMAAIAIGILCVTLINDVFGSPPVWRGLDRRINDIWRDVRGYARDVLSGNQENPERTGALLAQISGLRDQVDIVAHDMADGRHRAAGARSAMLALVEIVQQLRLLRFLAYGDPLAITIKDQCLAALDDDHHAEALALLTKLREIELSRPDIVVGVVWQIQQAVRFVESKSLLDDGLLSLREGLEPALIPERVMVCMSSNALAPRVLRTGARIAGRLGAKWYAVYVETPKERPDRIKPHDSEALQQNIKLAEGLGATVVKVHAERPSDGLVAFAQREKKVR